MGKNVIKIVSLLFLGAIIGSCSLPAFSAKLYITDDTHDQRLYLLKVLGAGENSANEASIYDSPVDTVLWDGKSWLVYNIPEGRSDIYMEFTTPEGSGTNNERTEINATAGEWVAIWFIDSSTDDTQAWSGTGDFDLTSCPLYQY